jgi:hypothetical protein
MCAAGVVAAIEQWRLALSAENTYPPNSRILRCSS